MKIIKTTLLTGIILFVFCLTLISLPTSASAGAEINFVPSTTIPGSEFVAGTTITINSDSLGKYIIAIYNYGIGLVSVLAVVMIMFGGFKWIFAAGNATTIGAAKSTIISALVGLFLALGSWMLLDMINPALTSFKPLNPLPPKISTQGCPGLINRCEDFTIIKNDILESMEGGVNADGRIVRWEDYYCMDVVTQVACGFPEGLCYWGTPTEINNETGTCLSILDKECDTSGYGGSGDCDFMDQSGKMLYCETNFDDRCSLGVVGSDCIDNGECSTGYCNTHGTNRCTNGARGDECEDNSECQNNCDQGPDICE